MIRSASEKADRKAATWSIRQYIKRRFRDMLLVVVGA